MSPAEQDYRFGDFFILPGQNAIHRDNIRGLQVQKGSPGWMAIKYAIHQIWADLLDRLQSGNWRIIFNFEGGYASDTNLVDYH